MSNEKDDKKDSKDDEKITTPEQPAAESVKKDDKDKDQLDDFATKAYEAMGYKDRLSDNMVNIYRAFKTRKDRLQPGRLTPEGLAFVAVLADMADGKINIDKE